MDQPAVQSYLDLTPGALVRRLDEPYVVVQVTDFYTVKVAHVLTKEHHTFPRAELEPPFLETPEDKNAVEFKDVTEEDWDDAETRLAVIRPLVRNPYRTRLQVEELAKKKFSSPASIYRWLDAYEKNLRLSSLLPKQRSDAKNSKRLLPAVESIIEQAIDRKFKKKGKRRISAVRKDVKTYCIEQGLPIPGKTVVRDRVISIPEEEKLRAQIGPRAARDKFSQHRGRFPGADTPHAVWQIDHTELRQSVLHDNRLGAAGRPWITVVIDVKTTVVVGFYLTWDPPDTNSVGMALAMAILPKEKWLADRGIKASWPVWGEPGTVHADNAGEFRAEMLRAATLDLDMRLEWRPVKHPTYGAHVETMCGTLKEFLDGEIPGTGSRHLKDLQEYHPDKEAAMTLSELEAYIAKYIAEVYNKTPKESLQNRSPMKLYELGIFGDDKTPGIGLPIIRKNERDIRLQFMPFEMVTVQQYGIQWDVHYQAPCLKRWVHSLDPKTQETRKFIARRDRRDISVLYFYDPEDNEHYDVPWSDPSQPSMSLFELRAAKRKLRDEGRDDNNDMEVFRAHAELNAEVEAAVEKTKTARYAHARASHAKKSAARDKKVLSKKTPVDRTPASEQEPQDLEAALAAIDFTKVKPFKDR